MLHRERSARRTPPGGAHAPASRPLATRSPEETVERVIELVGIIQERESTARLDHHRLRPPDARVKPLQRRSRQDAIVRGVEDEDRTADRSESRGDVVVVHYPATERALGCGARRRARRAVAAFPGARWARPGKCGGPHSAARDRRNIFGFDSMRSAPVDRSPEGTLSAQTTRPPYSPVRPASSPASRHELEPVPSTPIPTTPAVHVASSAPGPPA